MLDQLTDAHLADKAAYGDADAFAALLERFGDRIWRVAALTAGDEATATRVTARTFTRALAAVAAGMSDPGVPIDRALVATAHELAGAARVDAGDLQLPAALAEAEPASRVAAWLEAHEGWSADDAGRATAAGPLFTAGPEVTAAARAASRDLDLVVPAAAAGTATEAWSEWQGVGLTIPEHHPLTTVLSRLDAPLGRLGSAMSRAGSGVAAAARRNRPHRPVRTAAPTHRPPAADHLPIGADDHPGAETADASTGRETREAVVADAAPAVPVAVAPVVEGDAVDLEAPIAHLTPAEEVIFAPHVQDLDLDLPDRRRRPLAIVTAGGSPTRARVIAALAAGILTASALGSLLTAAPEATDGSRRDQVAAGEPGPETGGAGNLLDDPVLIEPASASRGADDSEPAVVQGATAGNPNTGRTPRPGGGSPTAGPGASPGGGSGGDVAPAGAPDVAPAGGGGGGSDVTPSPAPSPGTPVTPGPPATPAPTAPAPTTAPPAPTTAPPAPPPTTAPPAPTTTAPAPPAPAPAGPVCTLLPVLCPGGGLVP